MPHERSGRRRRAGRRQPSFHGRRAGRRRRAARPGDVRHKRTAVVVGFVTGAQVHDHFVVGPGREAQVRLRFVGGDANEVVFAAPVFVPRFNDQLGPHHRRHLRKVQLQLLSVPLGGLAAFPHRRAAGVGNLHARTRHQPHHDVRVLFSKRVHFHQMLAFKQHDGDAAGQRFADLRRPGRKQHRAAKRGGGGGSSGSGSGPGAGPSAGPSASPGVWGCRPRRVSSHHEQICRRGLDDFRHGVHANDHLPAARLFCARIGAYVQRELPPGQRVHAQHVRHVKRRDANKVVFVFATVVVPQFQFDGRVAAVGQAFECQRDAVTATGGVPHRVFAAAVHDGAFALHGHGATLVQQKHFAVRVLFCEPVHVGEVGRLDQRHG